MKQQDYTIIKVITTILVVIAHITRFYSMGGGAIKMKYNFLLHYITSFVYSFHMPLFICVSGAIFSFCINNKKKYSDFRLFIIKKMETFNGSLFSNWNLLCHASNVYIKNN